MLSPFTFFVTASLAYALKPSDSKSDISMRSQVALRLHESFNITSWCHLKLQSEICKFRSNLFLNFFHPSHCFRFYVSYFACCFSIVVLHLTSTFVLLFHLTPSALEVTRNTHRLQLQTHFWTRKETIWSIICSEDLIILHAISEGHRNSVLTGWLVELTDSGSYNKCTEDNRIMEKV